MCVGYRHLPLMVKEFNTGPSRIQDIAAKQNHFQLQRNNYENINLGFIPASMICFSILLGAKFTLEIFKKAVSTTRSNKS